MKRKTILTKLTALLLVLSILFLGLTACENKKVSEKKQKEDTPEYSGVFSAEDGEFYIDGGEVYTSTNGKLAFSLNAVLTEEYYNELITKYGNNSTLSFYALAGKIVDAERKTLAEAEISSVPIEFTVENNASILKVQGTVEIDGYTFTEQEYVQFFNEGYFGEVFLTVKYTNEKGKTVCDKITAFGKETFDDYAPNQANIKIARFNVFILKTIESGNLTLTEDIDMKDVEWIPTSCFEGTLDGNYHVIKNLKASRRFGNDIENNGTGLFYQLGASSTIKNIGFVKVQHADERVGVLCGEVRGIGILNVENVFCYIVGDVSRFNGLIYYSTRSINFKNVLVYGQVKGNASDAGIFVARAGYANFTFKDCVGIAPENAYSGMFGGAYQPTSGVQTERTVTGKEGRDYGIYDSFEKAIQSTVYTNLSAFVQQSVGLYVE